MIHKKSTAAWHLIGGKKIYARSLWEARYAKYLELLRNNRHILEWDHEPKTFWFEGIKRGCVSYKPDFRITRMDKTVYWVEIKGYMDSKSATKIRRFKKYFPNENLIVVDKKWFNQNNSKMRLLVKGWD